MKINCCMRMATCLRQTDLTTILFLYFSKKTVTVCDLPNFQLINIQKAATSKMLLIHHQAQIFKIFKN